jgi:hypothetical protein
MRGRTIERTLWVVAAGAASFAFATLRDASAMSGRVAASPAPVGLVLPLPTLANADSLGEAVGIIAEGNLFRAERAAADPDRAAPVSAMGMPLAASTKPRLVLRGILGGPPWDALIDGVPGRDGALLVRAGQTIAGVTVRAVRRDTVFVRGFDTTWTLTLGRSW